MARLAHGSPPPPPPPPCPPSAGGLNCAHPAPSANNPKSQLERFVIGYGSPREEANVVDADAEVGVLRDVELDAEQLGGVELHRPAPAVLARVLERQLVGLPVGGEVDRLAVRVVAHLALGL